MASAHSSTINNRRNSSIYKPAGTEPNWGPGNPAELSPYEQWAGKYVDMFEEVDLTAE